jgi:hypothetical protein
MSEFSDRPFAVGSLYGIRSFRVTDAGRLTGVVHARPWRGGVNEAECVRPIVDGLAFGMAQLGISSARLAWQMQYLSAQTSGKVFLIKRPKPPKPAAARAAHDAGTLQCSCGFYAYSDLNHNPHHLPGNLLGIVEGFGVATVGSRGFRCSKARIRALIVDDFHQGFALAKVMPNYPDVPVYPSVAAALAEFPLTPPPDDLPVSSTATGQGGLVTVTWSIRDEASSAFRRLADRLRIPPGAGETPQERAIRLRRTRNVGPTARRGLDGRSRRRADQ